MTVKIIRAERNTRKLRVAAYIRVSQETEKQDGSYEAQAEYYRQLINANEEWDFAGIYGERVSGTHVENREAFQQMIRDAMDKKIDLILCKSVSRWGRNAIDALTNMQLLVGNYVNIVFEQEGIDTRQPGVFLQLVLAAEIAQQESKSLSENIKWLYRNRAARGIFIASRGRYFGYNTDNGTFTPDKNAKYVREIFTRYAEGAGTQTIASELSAQGVLTTRNNPFTRDAVRSILANEIYVGDIQFLKTQTSDTEEPVPPDLTLYVKNHHEALVDRELWNKVQTRLAENKIVIAKCSDMQEKILGILRKKPEISARGIGEALGINDNRAEYYLRKLKNKGRIIREGSPRKGKWIINEELKH